MITLCIRCGRDMASSAPCAKCNPEPASDSPRSEFERVVFDMARRAAEGVDLRRALREAAVHRRTLS